VLRIAPIAALVSALLVPILASASAGVGPGDHDWAIKSGEQVSFQAQDPDRSTEHRQSAHEYSRRTSGYSPASRGRGTWGGRPFDPDAAGGPIRSLSTEGVRVTGRGVDAVERHLARFGPDAPNAGMVQRLRRIAAGELSPTQTDLNFYAHELREFVRYRRLGHPTGAGGNWDLWNDAHTASLADYGLVEGPGVLYHPSVAP